MGLPVSRKSLPTDIAAKIDSMQVGQVSAPFETRFDNTLNVPPQQATDAGGRSHRTRC